MLQKILRFPPYSQAGYGQAATPQETAGAFAMFPESSKHFRGVQVGTVEELTTMLLAY